MFACASPKVEGDEQNELLNKGIDGGIDNLLSAHSSCGLVLNHIPAKSCGVNAVVDDAGDREEVSLNGQENGMENGMKQRANQSPGL